jgi:hypothetical protein
MDSARTFLLILEEQDGGSRVAGYFSLTMGSARRCWRRRSARLLLLARPPLPRLVVVDAIPHNPPAVIKM